MTSLLDSPATRVSAPPRTYGGWRRRRGIGIGSLDGRQSAVVLIAVGVVVISSAISLTLAAVMLLPAAAAVGVSLAHWDGVWAVDAALARFRFARASRAGQTSYRAGVVVDHPRAWQLPGSLASSRCITVEDGRGGHYALVWDRRTGLLTATLRVAATGTTLAGGGDADTWVANWGAWLASLGDEPTVVWVAVTVDTAPDVGESLRDKIEAQIDPHASAAAQLMLRELIAASPALAADVDTRVSITFDTSKAATRPDGLLDAAAEVSRSLAGLENSLGSCGMSVLGRANSVDVAAAVRTAFDPAARGTVKTVLDGLATGQADPEDLLSWADAGPTAAIERWADYTHDSGTSITWALRDAPRQQVTSAVLGRLTAPGQWPRRVTMTYQVFSTEEASKVVEAERNAASFRSAYRQRTKRDETARDHEDRDRATRAALEESQGAGVVLWSTYVTTTVTDPAELPAAAADVEQRAGTAKLRLRRMFGSQAAGFAATLPLGVYPPVLARRARR